MPVLEFSPTSLRTLRVQRGFSRQQLADVVHCHKSTVQRWEQGWRAPSGTAAALLTQALGCSTTDLYKAVAK